MDPVSYSYQRCIGAVDMVISTYHVALEQFIFRVGVSNAIGFN